LPARAAISFAPPVSLAKPRAGNVTAADFDGDGKPDVAVVGNAIGGGTGSSVSIFYGRGDGTFEPAVEIPIEEGDQWPYVVTADMTGDGMLDLVITQPGLNKVIILLNQGRRSYAPA